MTALKEILLWLSAPAGLALLAAVGKIVKDLRDAAVTRAAAKKTSECGHEETQKQLQTVIELLQGNLP